MVFRVNMVSAVEIMVFGGLEGIEAGEPRGLAMVGGEMIGGSERINFGGDCPTTAGYMGLFVVVIGIISGGVRVELWGEFGLMDDWCVIDGEGGSGRSKTFGEVNRVLL